MYNQPMILNIYKETTWTSFDVVAKLRGILGTRKIGHAGTLDPLAEGVLIILTEKDTKKQDQFMGLEKEYLAKIAFGADSPTYDMEGPLTFNEVVLSKGEFEVELNKAFKKYIGEFEQTVPAFSAAKVKGKRLYKQARAGNIDISKLPKKTVSVKSITLESLGEEKIKDSFLFIATIRIVCGKGFYVRSLAHDLGQDLGTGAVLTKLVRTRIGEYKVEDARKIEEITP